MSFYRYWNRQKKEGFDVLKDSSKKLQTIHKIDKKNRTENSTVKKEIPLLFTQDTENSYTAIQHKDWAYDSIQNLFKIGFNNNRIIKHRKKR